MNDCCAQGLGAVAFQPADRKFEGRTRHVERVQREANLLERVCALQGSDNLGVDSVKAGKEGAAVRC